MNEDGWREQGGGSSIRSLQFSISYTIFHNNLHFRPYSCSHIYLLFPLCTTCGVSIRSVSFRSVIKTDHFSKFIRSIKSRSDIKLHQTVQSSNEQKDRTIDGSVRERETDTRRGCYKLKSDNLHLVRQFIKKNKKATIK